MDPVSQKKPQVLVIQQQRKNNTSASSGENYPKKSLIVNDWEIDPDWKSGAELMNECKNKSILIKCGHKTVKQEQMKISAVQTKNNWNWDFDV